MKETDTKIEIGYGTGKGADAFSVGANAAANEQRKLKRTLRHSTGRPHLAQKRASSLN